MGFGDREVERMENVQKPEEGESMAKILRKYNRVGE